MKKSKSYINLEGIRREGEKEEKEKGRKKMAERQKRTEIVEEEGRRKMI